MVPVVNEIKKPFGVRRKYAKKEWSLVLGSLILKVMV